MPNQPSLSDMTDADIKHSIKAYNRAIKGLQASMHSVPREELMGYQRAIFNLQSRRDVLKLVLFRREEA